MNSDILQQFRFTKPYVVWYTDAMQLAEIESNNISASLFVLFGAKTKICPLFKKLVFPKVDKMANTYIVTFELVHLANTQDTVYEKLSQKYDIRKALLEHWPLIEIV